MLSFPLTARAALCASLLGLFLSCSACDSGDPEMGNLFNLDQRYAVGLDFPESDREDSRTLGSDSISLTFEVPSSAFGIGITTETQAQEASFMASLANEGYNVRSVLEIDLPTHARLALDAPLGADMDFLDRVSVFFSAEGLPTQRVGGTFPVTGTEEAFILSRSDVEAYLLQPSFRVHLTFEIGSAPPPDQTYQFRLTYEARFQVYDNEPASSEVVFEEERSVRYALQQEGYDVGDVVSARVTDVALLDSGTDYGFNGVSGISHLAPLEERLGVAHIRIGSPETGDVEEVASFRTFEEEVTSNGGVQYVRYAARAETDLDITSTVRRNGSVLVNAVLGLDEAAAARGERYSPVLTFDIVFEVPVPEGAGAWRADARTRELRVPVRVALGV